MSKAAKKPSTIKIPLRKCDAGVPHYAESEAWSAHLVKSATDELSAGCGDTRRRECLERQIRDNDFDWVEPFTFIDIFAVGSSYRGRSAAGVELMSIATDGVSSMLLTDFIAMVKVTNVVNGQVIGTWRYKKRGANYLLEYVGSAAA